MTNSSLISTPSTNERFHSPRWTKFCVISAGVISIASGLTGIIGWHAHFSRLLQVFPDAAPMQYNAAICFILCGVGLSLLNTRFARAARWSGGVAALLSSLTLLEYLTGRNFGIDQLLFKPYFEIATAFPGRMAPLTAACFTLFGTALGLAGAGGGCLKQLAGAGLLASIIGMIGFIAILGYLTGIKVAYGWGSYSTMAFNSATALLVLGMGMLLWSWQTAARQNQSFMHWVPVVASATLIVMVGTISAATARSLRSAMEWQKHTYEVLLSAQLLLTSFRDIQRGVSEYALTGKESVRAPYSHGIRDASQELAILSELTRDNPAQQQRLKALTAQLTDVRSYTSHFIYALGHSALSAGVSLESLEEGLRMLDQSATLIDAFKLEEQRLLIQRSALTTSEFRSTVRLLYLGTVMAAIFFVIGSLLVVSEVNRRKRVELELREVSGEVNTLSGLLPICAHCKKIRDDKGYWNKIEVYIQERSEATFSHGLCETCIKELYPEIADEVISGIRDDSSKGA